MTTNLLAAALTLKSGSFLAGDAVVEGSIVDAEQTGYGATYRIYQAADGTWLALAVPDVATWQRLVDVVGVDLPLLPPPLRTRPRLEAQGATEEVLERAFATKDAEAWLTALQAAGVPAERVVELDRSEFNARIVDDPVNRSLGRVASFPWGARGRLDQPAFPVRLGPAPRPAAPQRIPELGEHTDEMLGALGFDAEQRAALAAGGVTSAEARQ